MKIVLLKSTILFITSLVYISCNYSTKEVNEKQNTQPDYKSLGYYIVNTYPHDTTSFAEGLLFSDNLLYESTGSPLELPQTKSIIGIVNLESGKINSKVELDRKYFGEGIAILKDKIYQLTYKNKVGFVYDKKNFGKLGEFKIPSEEGWGLTTDGTFLIMSDGSNILKYLDTKTFSVVKEIIVRDEEGAVSKLNELEYREGYIYANIFTENKIVKINLKDGMVEANLDLTNIFNQIKTEYPSSLEMNGIAINSESGNLFITGKLWPKIFEITIFDKYQKVDNK